MSPFSDRLLWVENCEHAEPALEAALLADLLPPTLPSFFFILIPSVLPPGNAGDPRDPLKEIEINSMTLGLEIWNKVNVLLIKMGFKDILSSVDVACNP